MTCSLISFYLWVSTLWVVAFVSHFFYNYQFVSTNIELIRKNRSLLELFRRKSIQEIEFSFDVRKMNFSVCTKKSKWPEKNVFSRPIFRGMGIVRRDFFSCNQSCISRSITKEASLFLLLKECTFLQLEIGKKRREERKSWSTRNGKELSTLSSRVFSRLVQFFQLHRSRDIEK